MKVVALGGGGGAQQVLRGMLPYTTDLTGVIAVTDTGRSTGVARALVPMPAPGDLRATIAALALARDNPLAALLDYRLRTEAIPELDGMAVGNLLLAALTQQHGDFAHAALLLQHLVGCAARVLPVSTANAQLCAELADGMVVEGELAVRGLGKSPIRRIFLREQAAAYQPALDALRAADLITIGPGSLFTTLLATLAFDGVADALRASTATVVYVANTTTQPGQTDGLSLTDHVAALLDHVGSGVVDAVLLNDAPPPADHARLAAHGVMPLYAAAAQVAAIKALGVRVLLRPLSEANGENRQLWNKMDTIRHHPARLGAALYAMIESEV